MAKVIDGNELLYHFFQKSWLEDEPEAARSFIKKAIDELGVWMHPDYYTELPVVVPYAVRDSYCRPHNGSADEWGKPNSDGYFRDDNSLIKGIVSSMKVVSKSKWLRGMKGNGFTASHVWREPSDYATSHLLASCRPELNSFVPNLVWLPKQIAKLTDREGSFAQHYLQLLSWHIYGNVPVKTSATNLIDDIWKKLPAPKDVSDVVLPSVDQIAFFEYKPSIVEMRKIKRIGAVRDACDEILKTGVLTAKTLVSERYKQGLPYVQRHSLKALSDWLNTYLSAVK